MLCKIPITNLLLYGKCIYNGVDKVRLSRYNTYSTQKDLCSTL